MKPLRYERAILLRALAAGAAGTLVALVLLWVGPFSDRLRWTVAIFLALSWFGFAFSVESRVIFPLRTLGNLLSALREGDFSIRASGARRDDALGEVLREVNDLGRTLREQRLGAVEAATLLRKVMDGIDVAVFGFDDRGVLRLVNRAGEQLFGWPADMLLNSSVERLGLAECLREDRHILSMAFPARSGRWEIRKTRFRESGLPHELLFISDLSQTLREEERQVWQRLIRVLGHELNNSLAPIKSVAENMAAMLGRPERPGDWQEDLRCSLAVIASRADALARFMGSYARLARLPAPVKTPVDVGQWIRRVASLEQRLEVVVASGPALSISADPDQLDQLLINLVRNAADASLETRGAVELTWRRDGSSIEVLVRDQGSGLANPANLFVPFFTTKAGGAGIGLVLCRQIAEAHGGSLALENREPPPGSIARLRLPL